MSDELAGRLDIDALMDDYDHAREYTDAELRWLLEHEIGRRMRSEEDVMDVCDEYAALRNRCRLMRRRLREMTEDRNFWKELAYDLEDIGDSEPPESGMEVLSLQVVDMHEAHLRTVRRSAN